MSKFNYMATQQSYENSDERYTKPEAIYPLLKYISKDKVIWCPCDLESSYFVKIFKLNGFKVINSHINLGQDFYKYEPKNWDILITNPPFSNKREFISRTLSFKKPFCLLLPLTYLNDTTPYYLFKDIDLELMIFDKRMEFINTESNNKISFKSGYYAWKFFNKQVVFEKLESLQCLESNKWLEIINNMKYLDSIKQIKRIQDVLQ